MDPLLPGHLYGISVLDGEARHAGPVVCIQVDDQRARFRDDRTGDEIQVEVEGLDITSRDLRSTAATRLFLGDRWTPPEVQAFLGHRDPETTLAICTRVTSESLPQPSTLSRRTV
jgi:integrase